jgi:hypothetical protein
MDDDEIVAVVALLLVNEAEGMTDLVVVRANPAALMLMVCSPPSRPMLSEVKGLCASRRKRT